MTTAISALFAPILWRAAGRIDASRGHPATLREQNNSSWYTSLEEMTKGA